MSERKNRLQPIINVADSQERIAALELARIVKSQQTVRGQIERLRGYCDEYKASNLRNKQNNAMFADRRLFLSRLNQTIHQLVQQDALIEKKRIVSLEKWKKSRNWVSSLEKYTSRQMKLEKQQSNRFEQNEMDDLAGRSKLRQRSS